LRKLDLEKNMLNEKQQLAYDQFGQFVKSSETIFALFGAAGTGKSYTSAKLLEIMQDNTRPYQDFLWLAPTWKALRVSTAFLEKEGLRDYEIGFDAYGHIQGTPILTTTAQALGMRPDIKDDQDDKEVGFANQGSGLLRRLKPRFVVIDEVSMLSWSNMKTLTEQANDVGCQILILGDPNQLPPVKAKEIRWDKIRNKVELTQIMRQASDSAIPFFARKILEDESWSGMTGTGLVQSTSVIDDFLNEVRVPGATEDDWDVFVAYRNASVDRVQELACQKVYGHGAQSFEKGEVVVAQSALRNKSGLLVANQDQLTVVSADEGEGDWGRIVGLRNLAGRTVYPEYVNGADLANPKHPYSLELKYRGDVARDLQMKWAKEGKRRGGILDSERRQAWVNFFALKDQTVLNFSHPFAITSHKSQGSTYSRAYILSNEIAQFDKRALYVAATRPRDVLIY
jgi:hypothetical protein